jgi:hypothetical protein
MNKFFILIILVISSIASEDMKNFTTNRVYKNISKNAIFDSAKTLFNISNENNGNKDFILDSYIDKLEITKINFKYNVIIVGAAYTTKSNFINSIIKIREKANLDTILLKSNILFKEISLSKIITSNLRLCCFFFG